MHALLRVGDLSGGTNKQIGVIQNRVALQKSIMFLVKGFHVVASKCSVIEIRHEHSTRLHMYARDT